MSIYHYIKTTVIPLLYFSSICIIGFSVILSIILYIIFGGNIFGYWCGIIFFMCGLNLSM